MSPTTRVNILLYHSISNGDGPLCIPPDTFRWQMDVLSDLGYRAVPLRAYQAWQAGQEDFADRFVVLTFDDGYADFATTVVPELQRHGFGATVFLPTAFLDAVETGPPLAAEPTRRFLSWETVGSLAEHGVELGAHGVSHRDLTSLPMEEAGREMDTSRSVIEDRTGQPVLSFAPPFGRSSSRLRKEMAARFRCAVGTRLGAASSRSDLFDLPRIEMWYFRDPRRWRAFLERGGGVYFAVRQLLRQVRHLAVRTPAGTQRG